MRKVLITGGAGFIGSNFVHYWHARHPQDSIVVLDKLTYAGNPANLEDLWDTPRFTFVQGDICESALVVRLLREHAIDTIVNFAAESHVDRSIAGPQAFVQTNIVGTHVLLESARNAWLSPGGPATEHRFHQVSTDEVFGSLREGDAPFVETAAYAPSSPYAASKAAADHLVRAYHRTYGLNASISNCSNNFGPYHFPEKLVPLAILNLLQGRPLPLYGDGRNIRDWLYVRDHCHGIERVLEQGSAGGYYNIGGNNEWSNIELVQKLCNLMDGLFEADSALGRRFPSAPPARREACASLISFVDDRPGHDFRYALDISKSAADLGYAPRESFETALRETIEWYLENERWWRPLLDRNYLLWIERQYGVRAGASSPC